MATSKKTSRSQTTSAPASRHPSRGLAERASHSDHALAVATDLDASRSLDEARRVGVLSERADLDFLQ